MKKIIVLVLLQFMCYGVASACSHKEQLHLVFTGNKHNVSHAQISSLGKLLFANELIARELHGFSIELNHTTGRISLDIDEPKQIQKMLATIKKYLTQNDLKLTRVSYEQNLQPNHLLLASATTDSK